MGAGRRKQEQGMAALAEAPDRFPNMAGWTGAGSCVMIKQPAPIAITPGGIAIPEQFRAAYEAKTREDIGGLVIGVGPDVKHIKVGDRVMLKTNHQVMGIRQEDGDVAWCEEDEICGVLPRDKASEH